MLCFHRPWHKAPPTPHPSLWPNAFNIFFMQNETVRLKATGKATRWDTRERKTKGRQVEKSQGQQERAKCSLKINMLSI